MLMPGAFHLEQPVASYRFESNFRVILEAAPSQLGTCQRSSKSPYDSETTCALAGRERGLL
jgi:hypothetical protein